MSPNSLRTLVSRYALAAAALAVFALAFIRLAPQSAPPAFVAPPQARTRAAAPPAPAYRATQVSHGLTPFAHSAAAIEVPGRGLLAFWYGGTREGSADSAIYAAAFDDRTGGWGREEIVMAREPLQAALGRSVRKIGNPTAIVDREGRIWLFFVSVSVGGWAGSAINLVRSADGGRSWDAPRRLITSPFLNVSTLVKGAPFLHEDGTIGLPVYHEFIGKFGELLRLDRNARLLSKQRLAWGRYSLQPVIAPASRDEALGLMRYAGTPPGHILAVRTTDRGAHWSAPERTALPNPNSGIDLLRLEDGGLLLAFNNAPAGRAVLSLAHSGDEGRNWRLLHDVEDARGAGQPVETEFSYPWLLRSSDGSLHLLYTVDKRRIRHVRFNRAWLAQRIR